MTQYITRRAGRQVRTWTPYVALVDPQTGQQVARSTRHQAAERAARLLGLLCCAAGDYRIIQTNH